METILQPSLFRKNKIASAYQMEGENGWLLFRKIHSSKEGRGVLKKIEKAFSALEFQTVKMTSGRNLVVGTFFDPLLFSWVFVARTMQQKGKMVLALAIFHEEKARLDYFSLLDHLKILAV
ncbi:MAG: hypothetical protein ACOYK9_03315 [Chlamydiia bacterium]